METTIKMPELPQGATSGTLVEWTKKPGESVAQGEVLALIETEQATVGLEAACAGQMGNLLVEAGTTVEPGTDLAELATDGASAPASAPKKEKSVKKAYKPAAGPKGPVEPILMPKAGNDMEEGTVLAWKVAVGDTVKKGDVLFEIETDKATLDVEAEVEGTLRRIVVPEGEMIEVMKPVAYIAESDEDVDAYIAQHGGADEAAGETEAAPAELPEGPKGPVEAILMPKAGNDMEEGTILTWKVAEGDEIKVGDVLFEIETDKATLDVEAEVAGTLRRIIVKEGETIEVMKPVAVIAENDADADAFIALEAAKAKAEAPAAAPAPAAPAPAAPADAPAPAPAPSAVQTPVSSVGGRVKASPAARKFAAERGVNLATIANGSGPGGRILSTDVLTAPVGMPAAPGVPMLNPADYAPNPKAPVTTTRETLSTMRKAIAKNLTTSKQTVPHFYMKLQIEATRFLAYRKAQKAVCGATVNDVLVLAISRAMAKVPAFQSQFHGDTALQFSGSNIGIAVALPDGLRVPVVVGVDQMTLAELAAAAKQAIADTKAGKSVNMGQGTFTISNLGMAGIEEFTAIINPPEAGILAVGGVVEGVKVIDGAIKPTKTMTMWLSSDHRTVDGAVAAEFLGELKKILESPEVLG